MTSGDHLTRSIESACGEPRDKNRWNVYCYVPLRLFLLKRAIELFHTFIRQNVHPLIEQLQFDWMTTIV